MWNDTELGSMLERVNPVPDPETRPDRSEGSWTSLSSKRTDVSTQAPRPRYRLRGVLVAVALGVLLAVPAVALLLDDGPPLDRDFNTAKESMLTIH